MDWDNLVANHGKLSKRTTTARWANEFEVIRLSSQYLEKLQTTIIAQRTGGAERTFLDSSPEFWLATCVKNVFSTTKPKLA